MRLIRYAGYDDEGEIGRRRHIKREDPANATPIVRELLKIKEGKGLGDTEFCRMIGISFVKLWKWKRGDAAPQSRELERIAKLLGYRLTLEKMER